MKLKNFILISFVFLFLFNYSVVLAESSNAGFVDSSIWYSKENFVEGERIKIYTFVFNPNTTLFKGAVSFYDDTILLGKKDFSVPATEGKAISIDWNATVGSHRIFARIENAKLEIAPGKYEELELTNIETDKSNKVVAKKLPDVSNIKNKINEAIDSSTEPILAVGNNIVEKTPESITNPVSKAINAIESIRVSTSNQVEQQKAVVESEIENFSKAKPVISDKSSEKEDAEDIQKLEKTKNSTSSQTISNMEKPWKYVKLFFLTILGFVLAQPGLLYLILIILIIVLIRFVYKRIF